MASGPSSGNELVETQACLYALRVAELKELMKVMNVSTTGRKKDLQLRAEQLIQTGSPLIHEKIREVYMRHFGGRRYPKTPPKPPISHTTSLPPPTYIKHPDVKFKPHPFFKHLDTIVRPTLLASQAHSSYRGEKVMVLAFHLTPHQVHEIFVSESTPRNYRTQVVLRLCRRETSCEQEDFCPPRCNIQVNNNNCLIPDLVSRSDFRRPIKPINITTYVHTSPALVNTVTISWHDDVVYPQGFCVCIELMRALSSSDLIQILRSRGYKSPEVSRALVMDKLKAEHDSEVSATSLRVSLICPLGKARISYPCRSVACNHLQCFDAGTYLQMNEKKPRWVCPVCDKQAPFNDLIIDGLMMEICEQSEGNDIQFSSNGSWDIIKPSSKVKTTSISPVFISDNSPLRGSNINNPVIIDLTSDNEDNAAVEDYVTVSNSKAKPKMENNVSLSTSSSFNTVPETHPTFFVNSGLATNVITNDIVHIPVISDTRYTPGHTQPDLAIQGQQSSLLHESSSYGSSNFNVALTLPMIFMHPQTAYQSPSCTMDNAGLYSPVSSYQSDSSDTECTS